MIQVSKLFDLANQISLVSLQLKMEVELEWKCKAYSKNSFLRIHDNSGLWTIFTSLYSSSTLINLGTHGMKPYSKVEFAFPSFRAPAKIRLALTEAENWEYCIFSHVQMFSVVEEFPLRRRLEKRGRLLNLACRWRGQKSHNLQVRLLWWDWSIEISLRALSTLLSKSNHKVCICMVIVKSARMSVCCFKSELPELNTWPC